MRLIGISAGILSLFLTGCGQPKGMMVGGKPISHWLTACKDPNPKLRKTAVAKLGNVGTAYPAALPAVIGALNDSDPAVRCEAILALVRSGPAANEAIPTLTDMKRNDRNGQVRSYAAQALTKLQGDK